MQTELIHEANDVATELAKLDLKQEYLLDAGRAWLLAVSNWTPNHPRVYRGLSAWAESVKKLRDGLIPQRWTGIEERNYPLTVHPGGSLSIAIASGDHDTGIATGNPKNKVRKGPRTAEVVENNDMQLRLFDDEIPALPALQPEEEPSRLTYILLVYVDLQKREIRSELSLPRHMNDEGLITMWRKRIILGEVPFDGDPINVDLPKEPELDIEIRRRA